jgi:DNA-binding HxlR family transcriptional regulator
MSKKDREFDNAKITVFKMPPTHLVISIKDISDYGWQKALILAFLSHMGSFESTDLHKHIPCIPPKTIQRLINQMKKQNLILSGECEKHD